MTEMNVLGAFKKVSRMRVGRLPSFLFISNRSWSKEMKAASIPEKKAAKRMVMAIYIIMSGSMMCGVILRFR